MTRVRPDLVGVVWYAEENGEPKSLKAGDEVPEGVSLGDHVLAAEESPEPEAPAGNASTEAWQDYARSKGASEEDIAGKTRDELRDTYA